MMTDKIAIPVVLCTRNMIQIIELDMREALLSSREVTISISWQDSVVAPQVSLSLVNRSRSRIWTRWRLKHSFYGNTSVQVILVTAFAFCLQNSAPAHATGYLQRKPCEGGDRFEYLCDVSSRAGIGKCRNFSSFYRHHTLP